MQTAPDREVLDHQVLDQVDAGDDVAEREVLRGNPR
jgi:hypothetical protein